MNTNNWTRFHRHKISHKSIKKEVQNKFIISNIVVTHDAPPVFIPLNEEKPGEAPLKISELPIPLLGPPIVDRLHKQPQHEASDNINMLEPMLQLNTSWLQHATGFRCNVITTCRLT